MSPRVLLCALLLAFPATANAAGSHQLGLYKVDRHIDVAGEDEVHSVSCKSGDVALDGMWRIDNVDQDLDYQPDPPPGFGSTGKAAWDILESVLPERLEAVDRDTFEVQFHAVGGGDTQGKLFVTCLPDPTPKAQGHTHGWTVGPLVTSAPFAATPPETTAATGACPAGSMAIAPGFAWTGGSHGNVIRRWPAAGGWQWTFLTDATGGTVTVSHRCLTLRTDTAAGHRHTLKKRFVSDTLAVKPGLSTVEARCGEIYKGAIAAWDLGTFGNFDELWLLGHDPRPKIRAFKMLNADGVARNAQFGLWCFKDRT